MLRLSRVWRYRAPVRNFSKSVEYPAYEATNTEVDTGFYGRWRNRGFFNPDTQPNIIPGKKPFVMCLPPPNVTGDLHVGHALAMTVEDTLARWYRMCGHPVLLIPGTDHAGIATQVVVEKTLPEGVTRHTLGREKFVEKVEDWSLTKRKDIRYQIARIGVSADWTREFYTLSPELGSAVKEAFRRLYAVGKIYRADRIVNWCCTLQSAISDVEVEWMDVKEGRNVDLPGNQGSLHVGSLFNVVYHLRSGEKIQVATTRPETMLADTALAVHPSNKELAKLIGQEVQHPLIADRWLPIVGDEAVTDMGTGIIKVTPGHSAVDFDIAQRHSLPIINILNNDGTLNENAGEVYQGLSRSEARIAVLEDLKSINAIASRQDRQQRIPICSRTGDILEPIVRPQWFVRCSGEMAQKAIDVVVNGQLKFNPPGYDGEWMDWMHKCEDWCISRQLWWGHRIPAWSRTAADGSVEWRVPMNADEERQLIEDSEWHQDEDVLDTWFSSALLPFSALGWPNTQHPDFTQFYPNSCLETGVDIIFFWVARMVMLGLELTSKLPFTEVLLHGLICDQNGQKMSKSRGNTVNLTESLDGDGEQNGLGQRHRLFERRDVLRAFQTGEEVDLTKDTNGIMGSDLLRLTLLSYNSQQKQVNFSTDELENNRKFLKKLYNVIRFLLERTNKTIPKPLEVHHNDLQMLDRWLLHELNELVLRCHTVMQDRNHHLLGREVIDFTRTRLSGIYITSIFYNRGEEERHIQNSVIIFVLDAVLRLLHPVTPFITEFMWMAIQALLRESSPEQLSDKSICVANMPEYQPDAQWITQEDAVAIEEILDACKNIRRWISNDAQLREHFIGVEFPDKEFQNSFSSFVAGFLPVISNGSTEDGPSISAWKHFDVKFKKEANFKGLVSKYEDKISQKKQQRHRLMEKKTRTSLKMVNRLTKEIDAIEKDIEILESRQTASSGT